MSGKFGWAGLKVSRIALALRSGLGVVAVSICAAASVFVPAATAATGDIVTFSRDLTIPVPPASSFTASAGGDGWAVAMTPTAVYNVFHHQGTMQVACHFQSDASSCFAPKTITDGNGNHFAVSGQPGLTIDQSNGNLYVYGTRSSDASAGVVCIDTDNAAAFCGYTILAGAGDAPANSGVSTSVKVGSRLFAFNYVNGAGATGAQNRLLCFDMSTQAACAGQPFSVSFNGATSQVGGGFNIPSVTAIGGRIIVPMVASGTESLGCFDASTNGNCSGAWPVTATTVTGVGAAFPILSANGTPTGLCLPTAPLQCFDLSGGSLGTGPPGLGAVITQNSIWNGPAVTVGPRVYVANGNVDQVQCFDYNTGAGCANFPKTFSNLSLLYTVNPDPQRPTCLWVNADGGSLQIQNFDAFTGGACGQGAIRVLASSFVVESELCLPKSYESLQILQPPRSSYSSGTVAFQDGSGLSLAGERALDAEGKVDISDLNLNSPTGLPQFVINLVDAGSPGEVRIRLVWTGVEDPSCLREGTSIVELEKGKCQGKTPTINGTPGRDVITGTPGRDIIRGGRGNDTINAGDGNDIVCGNPGKDTLRGGNGKDRMRGNKGEDIVDGQTGKDRLHGDSGEDHLKGRTGDDFLQGGSGFDDCDGGKGNNRFRSCQVEVDRGDTTVVRA